MFIAPRVFEFCTPVLHSIASVWQPHLRLPFLCHHMLHLTASLLPFINPHLFPIQDKCPGPTSSPFPTFLSSSPFSYCPSLSFTTCHMAPSPFYNATICTLIPIQTLTYSLSSPNCFSYVLTRKTHTFLWEVTGAEGVVWGHVLLCLLNLSKRKSWLGSFSVISPPT